MKITVTSYGCRHGTHPEGLDLIVDARGVQNPYHDRRLRQLNGLHPEVKAEVLKAPQTTRYLQDIGYQIQVARAAGLESYAIGIYCTGGHHRSVVLAEEVGRRYAATVTHRDLDKR